MPKNYDIKLLCLDMEGTLVTKNSVNYHQNHQSGGWWGTFQKLGNKAISEGISNAQDWDDGLHNTFCDFMEEAVQIHKKYGLTKDMFNDVLEGIGYHKGVRSTISQVKDKGIITALISGGFVEQARRVKADLGIDHIFAGCDYFWNEDGTLAGWDLNETDYKGKVECLDTLCNIYDIERQNCVFVGDGRNDIYIAKAAGFSIAFNAHPELKKASNISFDYAPGKENFADILDYV